MGVTKAPRGRPAVLAIDAGNSKTDLALFASDGAILGSSRGEGFLPHQVGPVAAVEGLVPLVAEAADAAGVTLMGGSAQVVQHVSACLANADFPIEQERLAQAIDARGWGRTSSVANDTFALLRAGNDERRGIAVICGAGINCIGVLPDGRTVRFPAVGHISGDWGGGGHLWQEAMWWAARAEDGRGADSRLRSALPAHLGLTSMQSLIEAVHLGELAAERCHELTPILFAVAESGDQVAGDIVRRQAREIVALVDAAMRRLGVAGDPIDVLFGGGVLTAGHPLLMDTIDTLLRAFAPRARTRVVTTPLIVGAALLGLDHIGAPAEAAVTLRSTYSALTTERRDIRG